MDLISVLMLAFTAEVYTCTQIDVEKSPVFLDAAFELMELRFGIPREHLNVYVLNQCSDGLNVIFSGLHPESGRPEQWMVEWLPEIETLKILPRE